MKRWELKLPQKQKKKKKKAPVTSYLNQWIERRLAILTQSVLDVTAHIVTITCYFNTIT